LLLLQVVRRRGRLEILGIVDVDNGVLAPGVIENALGVVVLPASTWAMMPILGYRKGGSYGHLEVPSQG